MRVTRKGYLDEELLQHPNLQAPHFLTTIKELADAGITTYSKLIKVINNPDVAIDIRATACWTISNVHEALDKRYILKPLMQAVKSPHHKIQMSAIHSLSNLKNQQAIDYLVNRACDKQEDFNIRLQALQGLTYSRHPEYFSRLRAIVFDETDDIRSRSEALEWLYYTPEVNPIGDFIQLLQHPSHDLRFWAAYRLSLEHRNISKALSVLDEIAAFDHEIPKTWGWHIDREALMALEGIYWRKFFQRRRYWPHPPMYLISPAPEYYTFVQEYRTYNQDGFYGNLPIPTINLKIDPTWLKEKLLEQWPNVEIDVRNPKPKTYLLDWKIKIGRQNLMGGLHRDQYGIVLAGNQKAILEFAVWYRSIISNDQPLFLYEWADPGCELKQGMSTQDIQMGLKSLYNRL
ncbi:MAG: hypothetical protein GC179_08475 [Anaerolineaceae bacterium]|nr:hypothetical protein [Anaerolineaceae bacterium]